MINRHKPTLATIGATFLLLAFAAACGSSDGDNSADAGNSSLDGGGGTAGNGGAGTSANAGNGSAGTSANAGNGSAGSGGDIDAGDIDASNLDAGDMVPSGNPVDLGTAGDFVILSKSGISTVPKSVITGDIGVSPAAASYITGFSLSADASKQFATSSQVTGKVYAANYKAPTPAKMTAAVSDMELAFTDASSRAADVTELGAGNIGGMTLEPGVYKWGTGLLIPTDVKLSGSKTAVWIFQIAKNLTVSNGKKITMEGGALPQNVFWQVSGKVTLGTTSHFEGVVLSKTAITLGTGASINGRLLAQTAVAIDSSTIVQPAN